LAAAVALCGHRVVDISNRYGVEGNVDFANIAVWTSAIFQKIPPSKKISFVPVIADWIGEGARIGGVVMDGGKWFNISSRCEYLEVHRTILRENWKPDFVKIREWPERIDSSAIVDSSAQLRGCTVVGANCRVGLGAILEDTIVWPNAEIASQSHLKACIVRSRKKVSGIHQGTDI
jgi:NDP-sugar pyrophosphorylase family protein